MLLLCKYLYCDVIYINCYLLTHLFIKFTENSKKKVWHELDLLSHFVLLVWMGQFSCLCSRPCMWQNSCFEYVMLWNWNSQWLGIITFRSSEKGVPWKFWLDLRFPRDPKLKWILKWLPLDRGYFEFYFRKRRRFTNNLGTYVF